MTVRHNGALEVTLARDWSLPGFAAGPVRYQHAPHATSHDSFVQGGLAKRKL